MSKLVNVTLSTGDVVAVPEELAANLQPETRESQVLRGADEGQSERHSGALETVEAAGEGALDTLSFGGYGKLEGLVSPEAARMSSERATEHPYARGLGEAAALVAPGVGFAAPGLARAAGEGVEGLVAGSMLDAGRAVSPLSSTAAGVAAAAGRFTEGAILGVGANIAQSNVTGDPLTIQGAVADAGIAGILNAGIGALMDGLGGAGRRAQVDREEQLTGRAEGERAARYNEVLEKPPESWEDFRQSYAASQKAANATNRAIAKEAEAYTDFVSGPALNDAAKATEDVINGIRNERYAANGVKVEYVDGKPRAVMTAHDVTGDLAERRVLVNSAPPISEEMAARLDAYNQRITRIYKLEGGGFDLDATGKWVKDPSVPADPRRALEELRAIQTDLKAEFPKRASSLKNLPATPRDPVPTVTANDLPVTLPKTLKEFTRMGAGKIQALANGLDQGSAAAFQRLTTDLGMEIKPTVAQTVAGVHQSLGEYVKAIEGFQARLESTAAGEVDRYGKPTMLKMLNRSARYAAGRYADVGGPMGAVTRTVAGEALGRAMDRIENSTLGGALVAAKDSARHRIRDIVAKYALPTARIGNELRPVVAYLGAQFPSGRPDPEKDLRKQARNRAQEIRQAMITAPDSSYTALQGFLGAPNGVALKMHQQVLNALAYLNSVAPKDHGLDTTLTGSNWLPNHGESIELAHRLEAVLAPYDAMARQMSGGGHPAGAEALNQVWGALMAEHSGAVSMAAPLLANAGPQTAAALSMLYRTPLSGMNNPITITTLQGMYMKQAQMAQPQQAAPSRPNGRPPRVQSSVAGSNVSALISQ